MSYVSERFNEPVRLTSINQQIVDFYKKNGCFPKEITMEIEAYLFYPMLFKPEYSSLWLLGDLGYRGIPIKPRK